MHDCMSHLDYLDMVFVLICSVNSNILFAQVCIIYPIFWHCGLLRIIDSL